MPMTYLYIHYTSRLHSHNSFVLTSQPLLCKPAEARVAKWQEQWEATQSNLKTYDIHPKEQLPSGHTQPWRTCMADGQLSFARDRLPPRQRSICGATGTFRGETKQRRNCRNGGSSRTMDEHRCRHDMNELHVCYDFANI